MSTLSFKRRNDETDAKFISYREVMEKLVAESGDSMRDVARFLKRGGWYQKSAIWLMGAERTAVLDPDGGFIARLLNETMEYDRVFACHDDFGHEIANPETSGWWRKEFLEVLVFDYGIAAAPASLNAPTLEADTVEVDDADRAAALAKARRVERDADEAKSQVEALKLQLGEAQRTIDDLRRLVGDQSAVALHNTHLMRIALEVQRTYWDPIDRNKAKQEVIIADLMEKHGLLKPEASAVERVACPINRRK